MDGAPSLGGMLEKALGGWVLGTPHQPATLPPQPALRRPATEPLLRSRSAADPWRESRAATAAAAPGRWCWWCKASSKLPQLPTRALAAAGSDLCPECLHLKRKLGGCAERAARLGVPMELSLVELLALPRPRWCPLTDLPIAYGCRPTEAAGDVAEAWEAVTWCMAANLDRRVPSRGYVVGNVWIVSALGNYIKSDATGAEVARVAEGLRCPRPIAFVDHAQAVQRVAEVRPDALPAAVAGTFCPSCRRPLIDDSPDSPLALTGKHARGRCSECTSRFGSYRTCGEKSRAEREGVTLQAAATYLMSAAAAGEPRAPAARHVAEHWTPSQLFASSLDAATCPLLGVPLRFGRAAVEGGSGDAASLDRIDPTAGYVQGNVWWVSARANAIKNAAAPAMIARVAARLVEMGL